MKHLLVTGGTGFVAQALFPKLVSANWKIRTTLRDQEDTERLPREVEGRVLGNLEKISDWKPLMKGLDAVVHLVARVHQMKEKEEGISDAYQRANVELTRSLAEGAVKSGVKRFVFLSSVKVMGEETASGKAWNESSACSPQDDYGRSKLDAEKVLMEIALKTGLEIVLLRLPLVYGPGVKANMARLFRIVDSGIPLPLGSVQNARSLLFVGNLADAIRSTLDHPKAAGKTFLVSDGEDIASPELIRRIAHALDCPARLLSFPPALLRWAGKLTAKSQMVDRLLNSLVIDSARIRRELAWSPPFSMEEGLQETAKWYRSQTK